MASTDVLALRDLAEIASSSERLCSVHALVQRTTATKTKKGDPMVTMELADASRTMRGVIWSDKTAVQDIARKLDPGTAVKLLFKVTSYDNTPQLEVHNLRVLASEQIAAQRDQLYGPFFEFAQSHGAATLVFDIETVPGVERRHLPATVAEKLAKHAKQSERDPEAAMGLTPMFGKVISLAFGDAHAGADQKVHALVVPPAGREQDQFPEWITPMSEPELLSAFWALAARAETVVSFNGRAFDLPFLIGRSLVHGVPARVDLMSRPFSLRPHLDLYRVLAGERPLGPGGLDVVCWALGIESPKGEMDGSMVAPTYQTGDIEKIASYNAADVRATTALFARVSDLLLRYRSDW